jgi:methyl-accepting chemotaxis protein
MSNIFVNRHRIQPLGIALVMVASYFGAFTLAWQGIAAEIAAREKLAIALKLTHHAMELKFLSADLNGWQTAYAFDIIRNNPGASDDHSHVRATFLKSANSFREKLRDMPSGLLAANEKRDLKKAKLAFEAFMRTDEKVIAAYRLGGAENLQEANQLVLGLEIDTFQKISNTISRLAESILERSAQASKEASIASSQSSGMFIGGAIATLPLLFSCIMFVGRSFS